MTTVKILLRIATINKYYYNNKITLELGGNAKNAGNQGGDVLNQRGNLGIAVKMK